MINTDGEIRIWMYSCVRIRAGRFICFVHTLEVVMNK